MVHTILIAIVQFVGEALMQRNIQFYYNVTIRSDSPFVLLQFYAELTGEVHGIRLV